MVGSYEGRNSMKSELKKSYNESGDIYFLDIAGIGNLSREVGWYQGHVLRDFFEIMATRSNKSLDEVIKRFGLYERDRWVEASESIKEKIQHKEFINPETLKSMTYNSTKPAANIVFSHLDKDNFTYNGEDIADYSVVILKKKSINQIGLPQWMQDGIKDIVSPVIDYIRDNNIIDRKREIIAKNPEEKFLLIAEMRLRDSCYGIEELKFVENGLECIAKRIVGKIQGDKIINKVKEKLKNKINW